MSTGFNTKVASLLLGFCVLFVATNFVNKYVLSILKFTYPTIFQGWQTLVGAIVIRMLIVTGRIEALLVGKTRKEILPWLPGMVLFTGSIYAGSRALANLPIPVFLSFQNIVAVFSCTGDLIINKKLTSVGSYVMLMTIVISTIGVGVSDPEPLARGGDGYLWMCIHIVTSGLFSIYQKFVKTRLKLSSLESLYVCYIYSFLVLAPSSFLLGDALEARKFPYLYFTKFYIGCILSGVFGVLLCITTVRLQDANLQHIHYQQLCGIAKDGEDILFYTPFSFYSFSFSTILVRTMMTSLLSLPLFNMTITASHALWILINHVAALVWTEREQETNEQDDNLPDKNASLNSNIHDIVEDVRTS